MFYKSQVVLQTNNLKFKAAFGPLSLVIVDSDENGTKRKSFFFCHQFTRNYFVQTLNFLKLFRNTLLCTERNQTTL